MRVDLGNKIFYYSNFSDNTLPKNSQAYESIYTLADRGQLIEACFKFDSEKIHFQMKVDEEEALYFNINELKDFHEIGDGHGDSRANNGHSIFYNKDNKVFTIKFALPIQYHEQIEFLAKTNDGNKTKKLKGFVIVANKEVG